MTTVWTRVHTGFVDVFPVHSELLSTGAICTRCENLQLADANVAAHELVPAIAEALETRVPTAVFQHLDGRFEHRKLRRPKPWSTCSYGHHGCRAAEVTRNDSKLAVTAFRAPAFVLADFEETFTSGRDRETTAQMTLFVLADGALVAGRSQGHPGIQAMRDLTPLRGVAKHNLYNEWWEHLPAGGAHNRTATSPTHHEILSTYRQLRPDHFDTPPQAALTLVRDNLENSSRPR